jgi:hypothetical protein
MWSVVALVLAAMCSQTIAQPIPIVAQSSCPTSGYLQVTLSLNSNFANLTYNNPNGLLPTFFWPSSWPLTPGGPLPPNMCAYAIFFQPASPFDTTFMIDYNLCNATVTPLLGAGGGASQGSYVTMELVGFLYDPSTQQPHLPTIFTVTCIDPISLSVTAGIEDQNNNGVLNVGVGQSLHFDFSVDITQTTYTTMLPLACQFSNSPDPESSVATTVPFISLGCPVKNLPNNINPTQTSPWSYTVPFNAFQLPGTNNIYIQCLVRLCQTSDIFSCMRGCWGPNKAGDVPTPPPTAPLPTTLQVNLVVPLQTTIPVCTLGVMNKGYYVLQVLYTDSTATKQSKSLSINQQAQNLQVAYSSTVILQAVGGRQFKFIMSTAYCAGANFVCTGTTYVNFKCVAVF